MANRSAPTDGHENLQEQDSQPTDPSASVDTTIPIDTLQVVDQSEQPTGHVVPGQVTQQLVNRQLNQHLQSLEPTEEQRHLQVTEQRPQNLLPVDHLANLLPTAADLNHIQRTGVLGEVESSSSELEPLASSGLESLEQLN